MLLRSAISSFRRSREGPPPSILILHTVVVKRPNALLKPWSFSAASVCAVRFGNYITGGMKAVRQMRACIPPMAKHYIPLTLPRVNGEPDFSNYWVQSDPVLENSTKPYQPHPLTPNAGMSVELQHPTTRQQCNTSFQVLLNACHIHLKSHREGHTLTTM